MRELVNALARLTVSRASVMRPGNANPTGTVAATLRSLK